ncbi:MAG: helix-turn-helix domain-containing protein [Woeseiaceae bacterium]
MNDNSDNKKNINETSCGQELSKRRQKRDLSINDVAREIKIESSVIKKIESDEFHSIGAPVFVKGYLRQYSNLVGADDDLIIKKYNKLNPEHDTLPIVNDSATQISKFIVTPKSLILGLFGMILLLILTFLVLNIIDKEENSIVSTNEIPVIETEETEIQSEDDQIFFEENSIVSTNEIPVIETEDLTELNSLEPLLNITIFYNGLCWTEIFDSNGERLFFGLGDPQKNVSVNGTAPFDVMLGAADNLESIQVDGEEYTITNPVRRGEVMRFQVLSDLL